jgi:hypothetical protein
MPLIGACCELSWCEPIEARVRAVGVVQVDTDALVHHREHEASALDRQRLCAPWVEERHERTPLDRQDNRMPEYHLGRDAERQREYLVVPTLSARSST